MNATEIRKATRLPEAQAKALSALINKGPISTTDATDASVRRTYAALVAAGYASKCEMGNGYHFSTRYEAVPAKVAQIRQIADGRRLS